MEKRKLYGEFNGRENLWGWLLIGLYMAGFVCFFTFMPKCSDDYWYMMFLRPWYAAQGIIDPENGGNIFKAGIPFDAIWDTWVNHYETDNVRLGNLLAPVLLMFPKWFGSGLMAIVWLFTTICVLRVAGIEMRNKLGVGLGLVLLYFCLPWEVRMGSLDYQLNYIPASALVLWLALLLRNLRGSQHGLGKVLVLAVLAGFWHEGMAFVAFWGLVALIAVDRRYKNLPTIAAAATLVVCILLLISVPGMRARMTWGIKIQEVFGELRAILWAARISRSFLILQLLTLILTLSRKRNTIWCDTWFVMLEACSFAGFGLMMSVKGTADVSWPCSFSSIVGLLYLVNKVIPFRRPVYRIAGSVLIVPALCVMYTTMAFSAKVELGMRKEMKALVRHAYESASTGERPYFGERHTSQKFPLFCFSMPERAFGMQCTRYLYDYFTGVYTVNNISLIPECLRKVSSESGNAVAGGSPVRIFGGELYVSADSVGPLDINTQMWMPIDYGKGYVPAPVELEAFVSEGDGQRYLLVNPSTNWYVSHFKQIRRIGAAPANKEKTLERMRHL